MVLVEGIVEVSVEVYVGKVVVEVGVGIEYLGVYVVVEVVIVRVGVGIVYILF